MIKKALVFALIISCSVFSAYAIVTDDPTDLGGDARALGMGRAYTAISNDPNAVFFNPAGLATVKSLQVNGMYYTKIFGMYHTLSAAGAIPTPYGVFGVGYVGSGIDDIPVTVSSLEGLAGSYDSVVLISYGSSLGRFIQGWQRLYIGSTAKLFSRGFYGSVGDSGSGFNLDLGLKYVPYTWLNLGISKSNIMGVGINWTTGEKEELTSPTRFGVAVKILEGRGLIGFDAKVPSKSEEPTLYGIGGEYLLDEHFILRSGLAWNIDAQAGGVSVDPSVGFGLKQDLIRFDYAYKPYFSDSSSNTTHFFSLSYEGDIAEFMKIKIGKIDQDKFREEGMEKIPGATYDDLGNVVEGEEYTDSYQLFNFARTVAALKGFAPVSASMIDYEELYAAVMSNIKLAKEEQDPGRYGKGDIIPIIVEAPFDTDSIVAVMPNGDQVKLSYDEKATAWYGIWRVPEGVVAGVYRARVYATDFEGTKIASESTPFYIESKVAGIVPQKELTQTPPKTESKPVVEIKKEEQVPAKEVVTEPPVETKPAVVEEQNPVPVIETRVEEQAPVPQPVAETKPETQLGIGGPVEPGVVGISLLSPDDKVVSYNSSILVKGVAGSDITSVKVNGASVKVGANGAFSSSVAINLGKNLIIVEGASAGGKAEITRRILRLSMPAKKLPMEKAAMLTLFSDILNYPLNTSSTMTRGSAAVIITGLKGIKTSSEPDHSFKDVPYSYWAYKQIRACKDAGLLKGYPDGTFLPARKVSVSEFTTIVLRSEGIPHPKPVGSGPYWAMGVITKAKELKMMSNVENYGVAEFKKSALVGQAIEIVLSTKTGSEKASEILDWENGY